MTLWLAAFSKFSFVLFQKHGEDLKGTLFKQVVILGSSYVSSLVDVWPKDSFIQPYFLTFDSLHTSKLLEDASTCDVFKTADSTLLVVVPNIADILDLSSPRNNCRVEHTPYSLPFDSDKKDFFLSYTKSLSSSKSLFESKNQNVHIVFTFFPLLDMSKASKTMFYEQKEKLLAASFKCSCSFQKLRNCFKLKLNEKYRYLVDALNQYIFSKKWTQFGRNNFYGFFDFTPYSVKYWEQNWIPSCNETKILNSYNFNDSLHYFLYGIKSKCSITSSIASSTALDALEKCNKSTCKVYVIGDEWLNSVVENWPLVSTIKPYICIDSSLYLGSDSNLITKILSMTRKDEHCLIIFCLNLRSFASFEEFKECKGHKPLKYAVYKEGLYRNPKLFAENMCKDMENMRNVIYKRRANCKIVVSTSFPLYFDQINRYLCIRHNNETGHVVHSSFTFDLFNSLITESVPLEMITSVLMDIDSNLSSINKETGFDTLYVNSICKEFGDVSVTQKESTIPFYVEDKIPPPALASNLTKEMKEYIELQLKMIKNGKIDFHSKEYDKAYNTFNSEKEVMLEIMSVQEFQDKTDQPSLKHTTIPAHSRSMDNCLSSEEQLKNETAHFITGHQKSPNNELPTTSEVIISSEEKIPAAECMKKNVKESQVSTHPVSIASSKFRDNSFSKEQQAMDGICSSTDQQLSSNKKLQAVSEVIISSEEKIPAAECMKRNVKESQVSTQPVSIASSKFKDNSFSKEQQALDGICSSTDQQLSSNKKLQAVSEVIISAGEKIPAAECMKKNVKESQVSTQPVSIASSKFKDSSFSKERQAMDDICSSTDQQLSSKKMLQVVSEVIILSEEKIPAAECMKKNVKESQDSSQPVSIASSKFKDNSFSKEPQSVDGICLSTDQQLSSNKKLQAVSEVIISSEEKISAAECMKKNVKESQASSQPVSTASSKFKDNSFSKEPQAMGGISSSTDQQLSSNKKFQAVSKVFNSSGNKTPAAECMKKSVLECQNKTEQPPCKLPFLCVSSSIFFIFVKTNKNAPCIFLK